MKRYALVAFASLTVLTTLAGCTEAVDTMEEGSGSDKSALASVAGFTLVGLAPDAASMPPGGRVIRALHGYRGKVYYGYGNYTDNTGTATGRGTNVSYFDPATGS